MRSGVVVLAVIGITSTASLFLQLAYQPTSLVVYELVFDILRLFLRDNYSAFSLFLPVLLATYLLPLPVAALWYRRRLTAAVESRE